MSTGLGASRRMLVKNAEIEKLASDTIDKYGHDKANRIYDAWPRNEDLEDGSQQNAETMQRLFAICCEIRDEHLVEMEDSDELNEQKFINSNWRYI